MSASAVHAAKSCWFWNHLLSVSPNADVSYVRNVEIVTSDETHEEQPRSLLQALIHISLCAQEPRKTERHFSFD